MPQYTNFISMSQQCGGLCIHHKVGKIIGFCMMVCKAFCNKFPECKFHDLYIIRAEGYSLGHSRMCHLINTKDVWCQRWYIQNIWKIAILKINRTLSFEMMVESYPMWMGMDFSVSKVEKESLLAIMWFEAPESIKSALDFKVLAMRAWSYSCWYSRSWFSFLWKIFGIFMLFFSRREVASSKLFFMQACSGWNPFP